MKNAKYGIAITVAAVLLTAVLIGYVIYANAPLFSKTFSSITGWHLAGALLCSACAYACMGLALHGILRALDYRLGYAETLGIAFVSTTVNYLISSLGAGGFALRAHLLQKRNVPFCSVLVSSAVLLMLLYFVLALLVLQGCLLLIFSAGAGSAHVIEGILGVAALLTVCFAFAAMFFKTEWRSIWMRKGFRALNKLFYLFSIKQIPDENYVKFSEQVEEGIALIHAKKHKLTSVIVYVCGDWICTIGVLHMAFAGMGISLPAGQLIVGFAIGMAATLIPILPGGVGALEFGMTAAYSSFGVPWPTALTAVLIFRVAYYILPGLLSILIYWTLHLSDAGTAVGEGGCAK